MTALSSRSPVKRRYWKKEVNDTKDDDDADVTTTEASVDDCSPHLFEVDGKEVDE